MKCAGSGQYVGLESGQRVTCVDCGRRIKVNRNHRIVDHQNTTGQTDDQPSEDGREAER